MTLQDQIEYFDGNEYEMSKWKTFSWKEIHD